MFIIVKDIYGGINMNDNEDDVNVLDELNKGTCMGRDAIKMILDKVNDEGLRKELEKEYNNYKELSDRIVELYPEYDEGEPHETNILNKAMTWYGIEMKTSLDDTSSKLAELIMQGVNMGIIEGRRLLNSKDIDEQVHELTQRYVDMQVEAFELAEHNFEEFSMTYPLHIWMLMYIEKVEKFRNNFTDVVTSFYSLSEKLQNVQERSY